MTVTILDRLLTGSSGQQSAVGVDMTGIEDAYAKLKGLRDDKHGLQIRP